MNVKIGENIKRLRKERDMTQEQLAAELEVSFQAVSRWELGTTYPDIGLLPVIAGCFDVTVDELLGVDAERQEEEIQHIREQIFELSHEGKVYDAMCLLREKVKEYPNNAELLYNLALYTARYEDEDHEKMLEYAKEAIEICKKVIKYDKKTLFTDDCKRIMVINYAGLGEYEKALEIADTLPSLSISKELILPKALKDKSVALQWHQSNVFHAMDMLIQELWEIEWYDYTITQKLEIKLMLEKVILAVIGENPCLYNANLYFICIGIAWEYTKLKRYDEAMDTLERAMKYAGDFENRSVGGHFSVFWLSEMKDNPERDTKSHEWTLYEDMVKHMTNMCSHDSYYETNERFKAIREKVSSHITAK